MQREERRTRALSLSHSLRSRLSREITIFITGRATLCILCYTIAKKLNSHSSSEFPGFSSCAQLTGFQRWHNNSSSDA
ncbi:hypothetical protein Q8A67_019219 [Cirrhinus molitorella]|uniref:Uncharacterized protein n=1 Tax=Cirrhinus molitorella TaxID=172907 RepID=A0AA88TPI7_9TELE|nr:hypothetical protein Q8A67_019219 [Cirrhinus molitorella]